MSLNGWLANGWIARHDTSPEEIANLLSVADRDLADAALDRLSPDGRQSLAYNAALQLAAAALAASGYRAARNRAHERTIQSLPFTIGLARNLVDTLDGIRRKRNLSNYERAGSTSPSEAQEVIRLSLYIRRQVAAWLEQDHPELGVSSGDDVDP